MLPNEGKVYFYGQQGEEDHCTGLGFCHGSSDNAGLLRGNSGNVITRGILPTVQQGGGRYLPYHPSPHLTMLRSRLPLPYPPCSF